VPAKIFRYSSLYRSQGTRLPRSHCGIIFTGPWWAATSSPESLATLRSSRAIRGTSQPHDKSVIGELLAIIERLADGGVGVPAGEVKNLLAVLDIAADCNRDWAGLCADYAGQSGPICKSLARQPHAGTVFAIDGLGARGLPCLPYRGRTSRPFERQGQVACSPAQARILAFSRSNSSAVMTPLSRRSASLAS